MPVQNECTIALQRLLHARGSIGGLHYSLRYQPLIQRERVGQLGWIGGCPDYIHALIQFCNANSAYRHNSGKHFITFAMVSPMSQVAMVHLPHHAAPKSLLFLTYPPWLSTWYNGYTTFGLNYLLPLICVGLMAILSRGKHLYMMTKVYQAAGFALVCRMIC